MIIISTFCYYRVKLPQLFNLLLCSRLVEFSNLETVLIPVLNYELKVHGVIENRLMFTHPRKFACSFVPRNEITRRIQYNCQRSSVVL